MTTLVWLATTQSNDPIIQYVNYGVLGLTVVAFIIGKVVPGFIYDRAESRHKEELAAKDDQIRKQDEEIARLNAYIADSVIPAIIRFTDFQAAQAQHHAPPEGKGDV